MNCDICKKDLVVGDTFFRYKLDFKTNALKVNLLISCAACKEEAFTRASASQDKNDDSMIELEFGSVK